MEISTSLISVSSTSANLVEIFNLYLGENQTGEIQLISFNIDLNKTVKINCISSEININSSNAVLKIANGIAIAITASMSIKTYRAGLTYKQLSIFPSIRPTSRQFLMPQLPISRIKAMNNKVSRTILASKVGRGTMSLSYENIMDSEANQFLNSYEQSKGSVKPFLLPSNTLSGMDDVLQEYATVRVVDRPLKPGDLLLISVPTYGENLTPEFRWFKNGVEVEGAEENFYILGPDGDILENGTVTVEAMYRYPGETNWTPAQPFQTKYSITWRWSRPPIIQSVKKGVSTVSVELETDSSNKTPAFNITAISLPAYYPPCTSGGESGPPEEAPKPIFEFYNSWGGVVMFGLISKPGWIGWYRGVVYAEYESSGDQETAYHYYDDANTDAVEKIFLGEIFYNKEGSTIGNGLLYNNKSVPFTPVMRFRYSENEPWTVVRYDGLLFAKLTGGSVRKNPTTYDEAYAPYQHPSGIRPGYWTFVPPLSGPPS